MRSNGYGTSDAALPARNTARAERIPSIPAIEKRAITARNGFSASGRAVIASTPGVPNFSTTRSIIAVAPVPSKTECGSAKPR